MNKCLGTFIGMLLYVLSASAQERNFYLEFAWVDQDINRCKHYLKTADAEADINTRIQYHDFDSENLQDECFSAFEADEEKRLRSFEDIDSSTVFIALNIHNMEFIKHNSFQEKVTLTYDLFATDFQNSDLMTDTSVNFSKLIAVQDGVDSRKIRKRFLRSFRSNIVKRLDSLPVDSVFDYNKNLVLSKLDSVTSIDCLLKNNLVLASKSRAISGVLLSAEGHFLTDARILRHGTRNVWAINADGDSSAFKIVRQNKLLHLALCKLKDSTVADIYEPQRISRKVELTDPFSCYGTPGLLDLKHSYFQGIVAGKVDILGFPHFFIDVTPHYGFSGAGAYDTDGKLTGVALALSFDDNLNLVMPFVEAQALETIFNVKL